MNSVLKNVAANFLGQGWAALMGICFVPLYLKFIGIEGYGLIGFFVILSSAMSMLDGGFGAVATKEASVYESASSLEKKKVILLLRSVEWVLGYCTHCWCGGDIVSAADFQLLVGYKS